MAGSRVLYAERRPYVVARSLRELKGPTTGRVRLPLHLDWSEQGTYDLDDEATLRLMYERVLREAQSADDLRRYLNGDELRRVWPDLFLPRQVSQLWEQRFPELATA